MRTLSLIAALLALAGPALAVSLAFSPQQIGDWQRERFKNETLYTLEADAVHARCQNSASGLFLRQTIDLRATPILEWSWRVDAVFDASVNEKTKTGDDFSARIYVVKDGGVAVWRTRAINYVWASTLPPGSDWPNPFASQAHMLALRSGPPPAPGQWVTERRNIRDDFLRYLGRDVESVDAVAIMTDCDNRGGSAEAWYGPVRLVAE